MAGRGVGLWDREREELVTAGRSFLLKRTRFRSDASYTELLNHRPAL